MHIDIDRHAQQGSALIYILIAIALLSALTFTFMEPSSQQTSSQSGFKTLTALESQANLVRSAIEECVLSYPKGDPTIVTSGAGTTDPDAKKNYPISPDSQHYSSATPGRSGDEYVKNIRCPGNNPGGADIANHTLLFSGASGKFLPPKPDLFEDWEYYNGEDGVFFFIATSKSDAFLGTALTKLDEKFAECEADVVNARSAAQNMDSNGVFTCPAGSLCFRVWMRKNPTAVFNGDSDGDESSCT